GQLRGYLHPLRLAAREGYGGLTEGDITQTYVLQRFDLAVKIRYGLEEVYRLFHRHVQHIGNGFAFVADLQCFAVITATVTLFAMHIYIGQEVHFYHTHAGAFANVTAAAFYVEGETACVVAPDLCFGHRGEQLPDF